jgi:hypothetical protein
MATSHRSRAILGTIVERGRLRTRGGALRHERAMDAVDGAPRAISSPFNRW